MAKSGKRGPVGRPIDKLSADDRRIILGGPVPTLYRAATYGVVPTLSRALASGQYVRDMANREALQ